MYNQELSYYIVFIIIREFDDQPVYEIPPPKYQAERILKILLDPTIPPSKICLLIINAYNVYIWQLNTSTYSRKA